MPNVLVHGAGRNFCTALIAVDEPAIQARAGENGLEGKSYEQVVAAPATVELIGGYVRYLNVGLQQRQTNKMPRLLSRDLDVDRGDITPSLKRKRSEVEREYKPPRQDIRGHTRGVGLARVLVRMTLVPPITHQRQLVGATP